MPTPSEEISQYNQNGKTDSNLANDALHLGGVPADDFATKKYVQDYHGAKEETLKEYLERQDETNLQEAKNYTDTAIRNQDFSDFLKSADGIALEQKINNCANECANNLNTTKTQINGRIDNVVSDVNSNFDDVNTAIATLNNTTNNLFTSVSNGKSQVASAITDKGVSTASDASFATMANNIRNIQTNSGSSSGGNSSSSSNTGLDTSDATAVSDTIFAGYTAYARGQKILGTYVPPYEREQDGITYVDNGIDTSDATATASDIAVGKTAYVNGNKITGTYRQVTDTTRSGYNTVSVSNQDNSSSEIIEYYGASMDDYNIKTSSLLSGNTRLISFTPDNTYSIQMCMNNGTATSVLGEGLFDYKLVTHRIFDGEQVYTSSVHATSSEQDKYEWTKAELGLAENEVVVDMILGSPGVMGREDLCWLILQVDTYISSNNGYTYDHYRNGYKFYLYTFNMTKSGIIGKVSSSDTHFVWHKEISLPQVSSNQSYKILAANLNCNTFMIIEKTGGTGDTKYLYYGYAKISTSTTFDATNGLDVSLVKTLNRYGVSNYSITLPQLSSDDRYINTCAEYSNDGMILSIAEDYSLKGYYLFSAYYRYLYIPTHNKILRFRVTYTGDGNVDILDGGSTSSITAGNVIEGITSLGTITLPTPRASHPYYLGRYVFLSADYSKIFISYSSGQYQGSIGEDTNRIWIVYDVDDLLHVDGNGNLDPIFTELQRSELLPPAKTISVSRGSEKIVMANPTTGNFIVWNDKIDKNNVIMVKYKDMWFQRLKYGQLTAGQPDVKNGKTFIGWMGYPETGTNTDI